MFNSFQKDYIDQHIEYPKWKLGKWTLFILTMYALVSYGLFAVVQASEPFSEQFQNVLFFGATLCIMLHTLAIPLLVLSIIVPTGANALMTGIGAVAKGIAKNDDELDGDEVALLMESQKMKGFRGKHLTILRPTTISILQKCLVRALLMTLTVGLVMNGYMFGGVVMVISFILSLALNGVNFRRAKDHILTLTYENVKDMELSLAKQDLSLAKQSLPPMEITIVDVDANQTLN